MSTPRIELQAELGAPRDLVFELVATQQGLSRWLDEAELEPRLDGLVRLRLRDAHVEGQVIAFDPPQHISFSWDYPEEPLGVPTVVAFDVIDHGSRSHVTLRHVGFRSTGQVELHEALWRVWFPRLRAAAEARGAASPLPDGAATTP